MAREIRLAEQLHVPVLTLDAFLLETARDRLSAASPELLERITAARVGRAAVPVPERKSREKDGEIGKIHVFVANPNNYGPDGHVDAMLKLPVTKEEFAEALRFIGIGGKYTPQTDYYFHSVQTWDNSFRGCMPRKVDDQGFNELNYLAAKLNGLTEPQREVLLAVMESSQHCGDVKDIINVTENLNCFDLLPFSNETEYGEFLIKFGLDDHAEALSALEDSDYPEDRSLAAYIERMQAHLSPEKVGREAVARENVVFTDYGYLNGGDGFREVYRGPEDIPAEHRVVDSPEAPARETGRASVMEQIAASRAERAAAPEKPAPDKPRKSRSPEL